MILFIIMMMLYLQFAVQPSKHRTSHQNPESSVALYMPLPLHPILTPNLLHLFE